MADILIKNIPIPTALDMANCASTTLSTGYGQFGGCIVLAGFDISNLIADCELADSICNPAKYEDYDGLSMIIVLRNYNPRSSQWWGFCLEDKTCLLANPGWSPESMQQLYLPGDLLSEYQPGKE